MLIYVIQPGDSLWEIAQWQGVSMDAIIYANQLQHPDRLVVGQAIIIPKPDRYHIVEAGETLFEIANRNGLSVEALAGANHIQNPAVISPGQILFIPQASRPVIEVNAYLTSMGEEGVERVQEAGGNLTYLAPFSYHVQSDGSLANLEDTQVIDAANAQDAAPMMVITNFTSDGFSSDLAHTILTSTDVQDTLISNIRTTMQNKGYRALNVDFEYVNSDDREAYVQFLGRVTDGLHPDYYVSAALAPKTSGEQTGLLYTAHDYPAIGGTVDFVIVMTYEWGWAGGPPQAISPINRVRDVLDYAVSVIPEDKIMMGASNYGRDWPLPYVSGETMARTVTEQEAVDLAAEHNVAIQFDIGPQAPHFQYVDDQGTSREVWYEDARSMSAKFEAIKDYNLRGISYWVLNYRLPQTWPLQENEFQTKKL